MRARLILAALLVLATFGVAGAQVNGPPIAPDQVLRQQNQPMAVPRSVPVPATPPGGSVGRVSPPSVVGGGDQRVRDCRQQAAEQRVPRSRRQAYVHACIND